MGWWTNDQYQTILSIVNSILNTNTSILSANQAIGRKLDAVSKQMDALTTLVKTMPTKADLKAVLDALTKDVADQTSVVTSNHQLLTNLTAMVADLTAKINAADNIPQDIVDQANAIDQTLKQNSNQIVQDVIANTPAAAGQ